MASRRWDSSSSRLLKVICFRNCPESFKGMTSFKSQIILVETIIVLIKGAWVTDNLSDLLKVDTARKRWS